MLNPIIFSLLVSLFISPLWASWSLPAKTRSEPVMQKAVLSDRERLAVLENQTHEFMGHAFPEALESMQKKLEENQAKIHELQQTIASAKASQETQLAAMKAMIAQLKKEPDASESAQVSKKQQVEAPIVAEQASEKRDELSDYQAAFALLQANHNQESLLAFQDYLTHFPQGKYTPNVLYWMASLELRQGKAEQAITRLNTLVNDFSSSQKAASAWFKLAKIHHFQGDHERARSSLQMILSNYAHSSEAHEATNLLKTWFDQPQS